MNCPFFLSQDKSDKSYLRFILLFYLSSMLCSVVSSCVSVLLNGAK